MIELVDIAHSFDGKPVLHNISMRLDHKRTAIIGANGSGKSTLGRILNGLVRADRGEVIIDGVSTRKDQARARRDVGLVFQNPDHQIIMPSVEEDLAFGLRNLNLPGEEIARRIDAVLDAHGLGEKRQHPAHLLSGGEKKLLSILSVIVMEPRYVVFDEPFASLDLANRLRIAALIDALAQPVIAITHDLDLIAGYDRILWIDAGVVAGDGSPDIIIPRYIESVTACSPSMSRATRPFTGLARG
jgi:biotin transport system ATP-binding protein